MSIGLQSALCGFHTGQRVYLVYNPYPLGFSKCWRAEVTEIRIRYGAPAIRIRGTGTDYEKEWFQPNGFAKGWNTLFLMTEAEVDQDGGPQNLQNPISAGVA